MTKPNKDRRYRIFPLAKELIESGEATKINHLVDAFGVNRSTWYRWIAQDLRGSARKIDKLPPKIAVWLDQNKSLEPKKEELPSYEELKQKISITTQEDRAIIYERVMKAVEIDGKNDRELLEICGYDPDMWTLKTHNITLGLAQKGQKVGGGIEPIAWIKLYIEPLKAHGIPVVDVFSSIDKYFEKREKLKTKTIKPKIHTQKGYILETPAVDWHIGTEAFDQTVTIYGLMFEG